MFFCTLWQFLCSGHIAEENYSLMLHVAVRESGGAVMESPVDGGDWRLCDYLVR